jgi:hypothetical protein
MEKKINKKIIFIIIIMNGKKFLLKNFLCNILINGKKNNFVYILFMKKFKLFQIIYILSKFKNL